jgi:hypothetical protein
MRIEIGNSGYSNPRTALVGWFWAIVNMAKDGSAAYIFQWFGPNSGCERRFRGLPGITSDPLRNHFRANDAVE